MERINFLSPHLFPELLQAVSNGYKEHFVLLTNGLLRCLSNPTKYYDFQEIHVDAVVACLLIPANLYLIVTLDGLYRGTAIEFLQDSV